jgi:hypothetical protein
VVGDRTNCALNCTVITCSCTRSANYWTSTPTVFNAQFAWLHSFSDGSTTFTSKLNGCYVRAVRSTP